MLLPNPCLHEAHAYGHTRATLPAAVTYHPLVTALLPPPPRRLTAATPCPLLSPSSRPYTDTNTAHTCGASPWAQVLRLPTSKAASSTPPPTPLPAHRAYTHFCRSLSSMLRLRPPPAGLPAFSHFPLHPSPASGQAPTAALNQLPSLVSQPRGLLPAAAPPLRSLLDGVTQAEVFKRWPEAGSLPPPTLPSRSSSLLCTKNHPAFPSCLSMLCVSYTLTL